MRSKNISDTWKGRCLHANIRGPPPNAMCPPRNEKFEGILDDELHNPSIKGWDYPEIPMISCYLEVVDFLH